MKKPAQPLKWIINIVLCASIITGLFIYSQDNLKEKLDSSVEAAGPLDLGMVPNLDIDVAGPYVSKSEIINRDNGNVRNEVYKYANDNSSGTMPTIEFGGSTSNGSPRQNNGIEKIDWIPEGESANYYRQILENARTSDDGSFHYNKRLLGNGVSGVNGYYFVSNNSTVDCQNLPSREALNPSAVGLSVLQPGNNNAVNYRFARGKVRNIYSANGNVVAIVEGRIYYDNVCTFRYNESGNQEDPGNLGGCNESNGQAESARREHPVNVSFPISAVVIYRNSAPDDNKWITSQVSHLMYKSAVIDVGGRTDLIIWGFNGVGGLNTDVRIVRLGGTTNSQACSGTLLVTRDIGGQWSYNKAFGGLQGDANFLAYADIFGARTRYDSSLRVLSNGQVAMTAAETFSTREPIFASDGKLYITIVGYQNTPTTGVDLGFSYILSINAAPDIANLLYSKTYRYLRWQKDGDEWQNQCFQYGSGDTEMILRRSSLQRCILEPRDALGFASPRIVPLLPDGSTNHRLEFSNGTFFERADSPALNRAMNISEVRDSSYASYSIYANMMAGSYFTEDGLQKNIIGIADNAGLDGSPSTIRLIWIGGENIRRKPVLNSFTVSCDTSAVGNPFRLKFSVVSEGRGAQVISNSILINPHNIAGNPSDSENRYNSINFAHFAANGGSPEFVRLYNYNTPGSNFIDHSGQPRSFYALQKNPNYRNSVPGLAPQPVADDVIYSVLNSSFVTSGAVTTFSFTVEFNRNNTYYKQFYNSPGFNLYLFMRDTKNSSETVQRPITFDPMTECAGLYYKTSNGDFRTNEPGAYVGQTLANAQVDYGSSQSHKGNKIWKNNGSDFRNYKAVNNPEKPGDSAISGALSFPDTSEFTFETPDANNVKCDTLQVNSVTDAKGFCFNLSQTNGFRLDDAVSYIQNNKEKIKQSFETKRLDSSTPQATNNWFSIDNSQELITVHLDRLASTINPENKNFYIEIDDISFNGKIYRVLVVDSIDAPDNIIVHCLQESCVMRIKNVSSIESTNQIVADYKNGLKTSFADYAKYKTRLYLNFNTTSDKYVPIVGSVATPFIPANRKVVLETTTNDQANYYLGGIITTGFVYTSSSTKTDILKGFILSRGLSARANNAGNKSLFFNDFPNPFLFIDYDPKFLVKFRGIFSMPPEDVKRTYIGLGD